MMYRWILNLVLGSREDRWQSLMDRVTFEFVLDIQRNVQGVERQHRIARQAVHSLRCHLQEKKDTA